MENKKLDKFAANMASGTEATIGIADATALVSLIGTGISGLPTLENITLTSKVKGETQAFELGVTMNDKPYAMSLIGNADQLVLVTDMLSKNYGVTVEELRTKFADSPAADVPDSFGATQNALEAQAALERYLDLLETTLRDKVEFTLTENGKNVVVNFASRPRMRRMYALRCMPRQRRTALLKSCCAAATRMYSLQSPQRRFAQRF